MAHRPFRMGGVPLARWGSVYFDADLWRMDSGIHYETARLQPGQSGAGGTVRAPEAAASRRAHCPFVRVGSRKGAYGYRLDPAFDSSAPDRDDRARRAPASSAPCTRAGPYSPA